ncbi:hypothetical protein SAMN05444817_10576 [Corynebacterium appendicis CIP 107643]|uniref:Uncharacterized protein n=1 Tax=Corynebacterium appendicis CIP 107643 TaxID=1161099 RepID=A0A1N7JAU7_9CORY|nr:hypothetical protein [Corynebacterium appendicis]MCT1684135.1 hypothetical protein [Corynebacterium appendicis]WJY60313.1 hypothetical protein CAPP_01850 [Corynebacterium appendicis CIP 107643]SIS46404.1 hypothetical protein SAMN05444817_10576 [Corynebacterium appendicis CIP 107643]
MDFQQFAEQFKERTARRMVEFERVLKESQRQMEQAARQQAAVHEMNIQKPPAPTPRGTYRGVRHGRVQGVLRKEGPTEQRPV